jgi:hypothetical protein
MNKDRSKTIHEAFVRFFESPTRESFGIFLREHVGEHKNCDFKEAWPDYSAVAKHILGLGNAGGGCLVFGIKENTDKSFTSTGLTQLQDKAEIISGIKFYLPHLLLSNIEIGDFSYDGPEFGKLSGKRFQIVFVSESEIDLPFVAMRGGTKIRLGAIYIRKGAETEEATYEEVQHLISKRLSAAPQTVEARNLKDHLEELKVLYAEIPKGRNLGWGIGQTELALMGSLLRGTFVPNPEFPMEDYEAFIRRMIQAKKKLIEDLISLPNSSYE